MNELDKLMNFYRVLKSRRLSTYSTARNQELKMKEKLQRTVNKRVRESVKSV